MCSLPVVTFICSLPIVAKTKEKEGECEHF